jgi:DNA-binding transcriptional regulator YiaG
MGMMLWPEFPPWRPSRAPEGFAPEGAAPYLPRMAISPEQFRHVLRRLGLSQMELSRLVKVNPRTVRRWTLGEFPVPEAVTLMLGAWEGRGATPGGQRVGKRRQRRKRG